MSCATPELLQQRFEEFQVLLDDFGEGVGKDIVYAVSSDASLEQNPFCRKRIDTRDVTEEVLGATRKLICAVGYEVSSTKRTSVVGLFTR